MHKYTELCSLFEKIEKTQSRNEMSFLLSDFFNSCESDEISIIAYMIQGRVAPMFVPSEFNYSEKSLLNLLSVYTSLDLESLRKQSGDIGNTVEEIWGEYGEKGQDYSIKDVYEILWEIVNTSGTGSISKKNKIVLECLKKLNSLESKFFVRTICGELRLGLSTRSLLDVFSISIVGDKSLKQSLEQAYGVCTDIGYIGRKAFESTKESVIENLQNISAIPGTPIHSRLVQRVGSFEELDKRFPENVILQPKFDGLRCQIHKWEEDSNFEYSKEVRIWEGFKKDTTNSIQDLFSTSNLSKIKVKLFTRNLEDVTEMFPEIVDAAKEIGGTSFILDSEIVGWDYKKGTFLSYQDTMQRRRKYAVQSKSTDIPVRAFTFDLLYLNGKSLVNSEIKDRLRSLSKVLSDTQGSIEMAESKEISGIENIKEYFNLCVSKGLEGIIVKQLPGGYQPGLRNYEWVKIKKSMEKDLVDTIDMVVVGYCKGSGRRANLGLGAILGAVYNEESDTYDSVCKIGTGMSDEIIKEMNDKLEKASLKEPQKNVRVESSLTPDIWVEPKYVITVDADEITENISNVDTNIAAGLSLRFPRLIEFDRDKSIEDITTVSELKDMYKMRKK